MDSSEGISNASSKHAILTERVPPSTAARV